MKGRIVEVVCYLPSSPGFNLSTKLDPDSGQDMPFLHLWNVDKCDTSGPHVPIFLLASTNASIVLHLDGRIETVGDILVHRLPCNDNHTQVYRVSVESTEDYTLCGEILSALLPKRCITVNVSSKPSTYLLVLLGTGFLQLLYNINNFYV